MRTVYEMASMISSKINKNLEGVEPTTLIIATVATIYFLQYLSWTYTRMDFRNFKQQVFDSTAQALQRVPFMNRYPKAEEKTNFRSKISFIGLLGAGKSTASAALKKLMTSHGGQCDYVSTDDAVLLTMRNQTHAIILRFQQDHDIKIHRSIFESDSPTAVFIDLYGESCFRKLEAMIVADLVEKSDANTFFDLGGKVPLRESLAKQLKSAGVIMVYLKVNPETIENHLSKNDTWQTRGIYRLAGSDGWRNLALQHRRERSEKYESVADIIIEADEKTSDEIAMEALREVKNRFGVVIQGIDNLVHEFTC